MKVLRKGVLTHGASGTRLYNIWNHMRYRCLSVKNHAYKRYGGRGIKVCKEWLTSYDKFKKWAMNNGYSSSLTINRINTNGNYSPSNCEWVDYKAQARNMRSNRILKFNGVKRCMAEWAEIMGINKFTLRHRLAVLKWPIEKALTKKARSFRHKQNSKKSPHRN